MSNSPSLRPPETDDELDSLDGSTIEDFPCNQATLLNNKEGKQVILESESGKKYLLLETIKVAIFGQVVKAEILESATSGNFVAIKIYRRSHISSGNACKEDPYSELAISRLLHDKNQNLLGSLEICGNDDFLFNVMPYVSSPELFDYLASRSAFDESLAKNVVHQVACGIMYLHSNNIAHRDLSLENILYCPVTGVAKIIDFGLGVQLNSFDVSFSKARKGYLVPNMMTGKITYLSPEVLIGQPMVNPFAIDIWAIGICTLYLLLGFPPLMQAHESDLRYTYMQTGRLKELLTQWHVELSEDALDFVQFLLKPNPSQRPTIESVLEHRWLSSVKHE
eukprot:CAMPEP_0202964182 /NCGR_PEP_ID=MMETSP1396-20130829/8262_1 /ASSEMBLY_ACC=CAM_ASM_000872 /TAXON_ID= /ORGANISM="Pseudokeronopsis sp., Strain Brazil" /LENGTH=336 /DNA_ID=CAMNT_0049686087 /DNA_START=46 /DNA_END=1056 /DNA_ORIENTATION=+